MSTQDWPVVRPTGTCAATGRALAEGEEFYSVLIEEGETFRREDYALDAWRGAPENAFCFFRSRVPAKKEGRRRPSVIGDDALADFFLRLEGEEEPARVQFRFVLALMLMRKRKLRYEGSRNTDGVETWEMTLVRDQSRHRVVNPRLTDDQIDTVGRELTALLQGELPVLAANDPDGADAPETGIDPPSDGFGEPAATLHKESL